MDEFSILPWEYRGSGASVGAHAAMEIGGRKRQFSLKMRDGVIYFKEPKRAPLWAVTRVFERALAGDELVEAWSAEMARENYGRYLVYRPHLVVDDASHDNSAPTAIALIHRGDWSGWAREWFAPHWHELPVHRDGRRLDVWGSKFQAATRRAFRHVGADLLDCVLPDDARREIETRWIAGDEAELRRVFEWATQLFVRPKSGLNRPAYWGPWFFVASNPVSVGGWGFSGSPAYHADLNFSPAFWPLLDVMRDNLHFVAMKWEALEIRSPAGGYAERQREVWGDAWRGNWKVDTPFIALQIKQQETLSAHDKLEASLQLRDWLRDKISPRQCHNWLGKALD